ncbi:MAG: protein NO VEIN domain-containing protein [Candidatus Angelobacter sp.]
MPLILAMNDSSESGIEYQDIPYFSYEYPVRYRKRVQPGTPFVYYRGRRKPGGGRQPQVYLGTGVIGEIHPSETVGRLVCEIKDGEPFASPLSFKNENGKPLEPGGARSGYYVEGVRVVSEEIFAGILTHAEALEALPSGPPSGSSSDKNGKLLRFGGGLYASPSAGREVETQSRAVITEFLEAKHHGARVDQMPANHPGYDLETDIPGLRYVEVKGTQAAIPRFLLSEGERLFGLAHLDEYQLFVVFGMELHSRSHLGIAVSRAPLSKARLTPFQWAGVLPLDQ